MESSDPQPQSPGALLRAERERRGISPREMADRLNWMPAYVAAIEENRFEVLRGTAFVRGYLRAYGKQLGLAESELLSAFEAMEPSAAVVQSKAKTLTMNSAPPRWRRPEVGIAAGVACALILVIALWWVQSTPDAEPSVTAAQALVATADTDIAELDTAEKLAGDEQVPSLVPDRGLAATAPDSLASRTELAEAGESQDSLAATALADLPDAGGEIEAAADTQTLVEAEPSPVLAVTVPVATASTGEEILQFRFSGDCWVEVRDGNEKLIYADLRRDGDRLALDGAPPFSILVGDARKVRLEYAGEPVDIVPPPGRVVTRFNVGES